MVPASVNDKFVIRFCVVAQNATDDDIEYAWKTLSKIATDVIEKMQLLVITTYRKFYIRSRGFYFFQQPSAAATIRGRPLIKGGFY